MLAAPLWSTFCTHIHVPQRLKPTDFFSLAIRLTFLELSEIAKFLDRSFMVPLRMNLNYIGHPLTFQLALSLS